MYEINRVLDIVKKEGVAGLAGKALRYSRTFAYSQLYASKIRRFGHNNQEDLLDFAYNNFSGLIKPMQFKSEIRRLLEIIKKMRPKKIMEIGTANGGTLFLLCRTIDEDASIISLDLPGGTFGGGYPKWKEKLYHSFALPGQKLNLIRADSHKQTSFDKIKNLLKDEKLDVLFIDGDHTYEGVKKDFEMYNNLVRKNGIIIFHDIVGHKRNKECQVDKFWDEIKKKNKGIEIIENKDQGWAGIGVIEKNW